MKTTINIVKKGALVCFLFAVTVQFSHAQMALENPPASVASIDFEAETIDYGTILKDTNGERTFTFKNNGNAPLVLTNVKSSCGCTVPNYSKAPILPGDEGEITVKYNTAKLGAFSKTVTVTSNAAVPKIILKVKGNVITSK